MSQKEELPPHGAGRWMRLDLHLHTPASEDYAEANVSYLDILREAERRQLDIIAFTDHNTVHGYELFRNEVEFLGRMVQANRCTDEEREHYAEFQRILNKITVLPGFEFTSHYGAHILGVFAPSTPLSVLEAVLLQLGVPTQEIKSGSCSIPNTKYVTEAYEIIARNGGIVIAPHVNAPSGVVTETLRMGSSGQSRVAATQSPHLHALEFVNFYTTHDTFLTPFFYNGQHEHYERAMFCIQGSDAHRVRRVGNDASDPRRAHGIGDRYFEAFLPEPSFEALKALLATTAFERVRVPKRDQKQWEIDNLRFNGESRHFILRPATSAYLDHAWQDLAALANTDGGVLIIGAIDDDQVRLAPPEISERLRTQIATMIEPKPALSMELMSYEGRELVRIEHVTVEKSRYHKNLMPVTYVIGDVAGVVESPVYAIFQMNEALKKLDTREFGGSGAPLRIFNASMPFDDAEPSMKWDGEWHITIEVFRDLGAAFGACLILIYVLMVGWFRSFLTPLIVMIAIPFSLVGILPAHGLMGAFFSATSMIGFMAGGGIVVRNSIILVDFIELRIREGMPLSEAVIDAGAVRFRPMLLTAMAVIVGAAVILADPIFQGLAIALMAGEVASLLISRMAVPVLYFMANRHALPETSTAS